MVHNITYIFSFVNYFFISVKVVVSSCKIIADYGIILLEKNMENEKIKSDLKIIKLLIIFTALFCAISIYFVFVGYKKDNISALVGGSVFLFVGAYGEYTFIKRIIKTKLAVSVGAVVENCAATTVTLVAEKLGISEHMALKRLAYLFENKYLVGYHLERGNIVKDNTKTIVVNEKRVNEPKKVVENNEKTKPLGKVTQKCPSCGATITFSEESVVCPYCTRVLTRE